MNIRNRTAKDAASIARYWGKSLCNPDWYKIQDADKDTATVYIFDVVGYPFISAKEFARDLDKIKANDILVRISSPGGDVFEGQAIASSLKNHPAKITTRVEGLAASIASIIAMAGDVVEMDADSFMMLHKPWVMAVGNENELRSTADVLNKIEGTFLDIYHGKSGIPKDELAAILQAETWFTAPECKANGLADSIVGGNREPIKNTFDLSMFANAPKSICSEKPKNEKMTRREIERALRDSGASRSFALSVAAGCRDNLDDDQRDSDDVKAIDNLIKILNN